MNVQNVNSLNVRLNIVSGNLLPMTSNDSSFPIFWKVYSGLIWLLEIVQITALINGCFNVPMEKVLTDGMIGIAVSIEVIFLVVQIHMHKKSVQQLIEKFNDIMHVNDEIMKNIVTDTIKSIQIPLKFYWLAGLISIFIWGTIPLTLIFEKNIFFYVDYKMPIILSKQPFSTTIFILGSIVVVLSSMYIFTKKVGVDSYMINLIMLLTAQYKYIALKISTILHDEVSQINYDSSNDQKKHYFKTNYYVEKEIKSLCQHHKAVLRISLLFKKLLSLNFTFIYIVSVFRFCCISMMVISIPSKSLVEGFVLVMYGIGGVVQLYIMCSCMQQLLDASTEITDQAFHENWYQFGSFVKQIFMFLIMANDLELKLSTCEKYNLSLPSFMVILNQSYSIALLLIKTS